jgi:amidase
MRPLYLGAETDFVDCPTHESLLAVFEENMTREQFENQHYLKRDTARENIEAMIADNGIDVILAPADARLASIAALSGYPHGVVPLGFVDFNGSPFGLNVLAWSGEEDKILAFMSAWEATFTHARKAPPLLINWHKL